ncbi:MAG TPA: ATP-binding protein [Luteibacter sp.]|uniref:ATP-binding protein n=1 Tax=Luteibacter sp. TaxID=1886636 RepID=UPI002CFF6FCE|nr:ATP-binding protein [Luteibacter sp.]HVI55828.1 ATP-binding protein [Luteibacter sp.]
MDVTFAGEPTVVLPVEDSSQIGHARRVALKESARAGLDETDAARVALIATELATNVLKHARTGEIHVAVVPGQGTRGVELLAVDRGPGFNLADCLPDGYSTGGTRGEGLGAVKRAADVFDMYADQRGSVLLARIYPKGCSRADLRFGATCHPLRTEVVSGDGWAMSVSDGAIGAMVVDGLGHGPQARDAAAAGTEAWVSDAQAEPTAALAAMDAAMHGTRGGAVAVARFDRAADTLRFAGIGNIAGSLQSPESSRGLASHPGIVGIQARRSQPFDFSPAQGLLLILHSDGLQSRWNLRDYPGLVTRHPAVVTALLHRDYSRGRDDATVLAIRLETSL